MQSLKSLILERKSEFVFADKGHRPTPRYVYLENRSMLRNHDFFLQMNYTEKKIPASLHFACQQ